MAAPGSLKRADAEEAIYYMGMHAEQRKPHLPLGLVTELQEQALVLLQVGIQLLQQLLVAACLPQQLLHSYCFGDRLQLLQLQ